MADELNPTVSVKIDDEEFVFSVPTPLDKARQGAREAAIRRSLDPSGNGRPDSLDFDTFALIRGMAVLELFLKQSSAKWVYSETKDPQNPIQVDITKFPAGKDRVIGEVGWRFQEAVDRFHGRGLSGTKPAADEAVASGEHRPEAL